MYETVRRHPNYFIAKLGENEYALQSVLPAQMICKCQESFERMGLYICKFREFRPLA
jgi:hypothetical protein